MQLGYSERARDDIASILDHIAGISPAGARNVHARLLEAFDRLKQHPFAGIETSRTDVRVVFVGRYPYKVFYRVAGDSLEILHVRHTARRPTDIT